MPVPELHRDMERFYSLLHELDNNLGGSRQLRHCDGKMGWPKGGVYLFFEEGECRNAQPAGRRVVRVGTHALTATSKTSLWNRLKQHLGSGHGGGNHRGSVFRLHVGAALIKKHGSHAVYLNWGMGASANRDVTDSERSMECQVSDYIGRMPILWLAVTTPEMRARIERNAIGMLSNKDNPTDPQSAAWLGNFSTRTAIRGSGLWNVNHTNDVYDPSFLDDLEDLIK